MKVKRMIESDVDTFKVGDIIDEQGQRIRFWLLRWRQHRSRGLPQLFFLWWRSPRFQNQNQKSVNDQRLNRSAAAVLLDGIQKPSS